VAHEPQEDEPNVFIACMNLVNDYVSSRAHFVRYNWFH